MMAANMERAEGASDEPSWASKIPVVSHQWLVLVGYTVSL